MADVRPSIDFAGVTRETGLVTNEAIQTLWLMILDQRRQIATLSASSASGANSHPFDVYMTDYGVTGSGDEGVQIQAAINATMAIPHGRLIWPPYQIHTTTTLVIGNDLAQPSFMSMEGPSPAWSYLIWDGPDDGVAIDLKYHKYFKLSGIGVLNGGSRGTTIGIRMSGPTGSSGTMDLAGMFERVSVNGFDCGILAGVSSPDAAASEIHYQNCTFDNCNVGWGCLNLNTLDHAFKMVLMSGCEMGMRVRAACNVYVDTGSASNAGIADFYLENSYATCTIENFRSENAERFIYAAGIGTLRVLSNLVLPSPAADDIQIEMIDTDSTINITDNDMYGYVAITSAAGGPKVLRMQNNRVQDTTTNLPFLWVTNDYGPAPMTVYLTGNDKITTNDGVRSGAYPDYPQAQFVKGSTDTGAGHNHSDFQPLSKDFRPHQSDSVIVPTPFTQLNRVHMLGFGSDADSRNLRDSVTFATSGTATYTFKRTINVAVSGGSFTVTVPSGSFTQMDVGKRLILPGVKSGGGDCYVFVKSITDATHIVYGVGIDGNRVYDTNASINAVVGEDEPDALYRIVGLAGNSTDAFWVDSTTYATTGFTMKCANAVSVATVNFLIAR